MIDTQIIRRTKTFNKTVTNSSKKSESNAFLLAFKKNHLYPKNKHDDKLGNDNTEQPKPAVRSDGGEAVGAKTFT